ncbi:tRNA lysidine(34) synthetase TilS [Pontimicrobium aquaticum]|uniref:tRNA(Ile)-lysidine synthase n=1 Tax=Pontimicrobium aquaticum TaxID=2565367 RepID=A0A4U0EQM0_9FLAO|nr:tRNA lysidine(34) synthetase TilS [Pontimicrobium aquaticum]TJY33921.1 tRNA lysidine(34) synthetase TilS [Pontimicrobium aquaticum]
MLKKIQNHINEQFSFIKNAKLLIAISGGVDSVVLAYLCKKLGLNISLAHCNFNLRGDESDADEDFVLQLAKDWELEVFIENFDTKQFATDNKLSTQMAARTLRYLWFKELKAQLKFDYVLTAHHADDNFETFLINLSRGTGLDGLLGIPQVNGDIVRPLLPFAREDIEQFAKQQKLQWREDSSNVSTKYLRNKLRHDVIPILKEINPQLLQNFEKTQQYLNDAKSIINDRVDEIAQNIVSKAKNNSKAFSISEIQQLNNSKAYLYELLNGYGFTQWNDILALLTAQSGKQVFSKTHRLLKDRAYLILSEIISVPDESIKINESQNLVLTPFGKLSISKGATKGKAQYNTAYFDLSSLSFPLTIRKWQEGDVFYPLGMKGKKKVSKYFKDEKFSLLDKENTWLLCSGDDIIWIVGHRTDNRFKVKSNTKEILKIMLQ